MAEHATDAYSLGISQPRDEVKLPDRRLSPVARVDNQMGVNARSHLYLSGERGRNCFPPQPDPNRRKSGPTMKIPDFPNCGEGRVRREVAGIAGILLT